MPFNKTSKILCIGKPEIWDGCGRIDWAGNKALKLCTRCNERRKMARKKKKTYCIKAESEKRRLEKQIYKIKRMEFLSKPKNRRCAVFPHQSATEIHHKKGRGKHYLNENTWLAVSRAGHNEIEARPQWAKEKGYSLNRGEICG